MPARLSPYSGNRQITSKSPDPTSSYKYLDGNSFWPGWLRPTTTSEANSVMISGAVFAAMMRGALAMGPIPPRSESCRRHKGSGAETNYGTSGATCTRRCAASRPSLRNVWNRKNSRSIRDKKRKLQIREAVQTRWKSTPSRYQGDLRRRKRWRYRDARRRVLRPSADDENSRAWPLERNRPRDTFARDLQACRRRRDAIALRWAASCGPSASRRWLRRDSHRRARTRARESSRTCCD